MRETLQLSTERWERVKEIVADALEENSPAARTAMIAERCGDDAELRSEVESLLKEPTGSVETFTIKANELVRREMSILPPGLRIGAYVILQELGRGGMGAVYLAERADGAFQKRVAIKVLKRGTDTDEVLRRFQGERQILARLNHPNIATLLDAGATDDGLPYFVMEYVEGAAINTYANEHNLSIHRRLELFRVICSAVSYAHQNLIVHRDLKPSNVLVAKDGQVKLLDFGIAKLVQEADLEHPNVTLTAHRMMTPEYASPEQVKGEPITTVSDVYSLGVFLYELLTGSRPYKLKTRTPEEINVAIREQMPDRPSTVAARSTSIDPQSANRNPRLLRGDLDNIVLKALRKEPERRYASVDQFSADIRRHLEGLPVRARKDTAAYRASKFLRRHKVAVAAAATVLIVLIAGIIATTLAARAARAQRARAERRFEDVRSLASSLLSELNNEAEKLSGSTKLRSILVQRTLAYLDSIAPEAGNNGALQRELATAYQKVGDIQGNTYFSNLGDIPGAIVSYEKAVGIRESLSKTAPQSSDDRHELALAHEGYADVLWGANRLSDTLLHYRNAQAILEALASAYPEQKDVRLDLSRVYHKMGDLYGNVDYSNLGDTAAGVASHRESLRLRQALAKEEPANRRYLDVLSESYLDLGVMQRTTGDLANAIENYRSSIAVQERFRAAEPDNPIFRRHIAFIQKHLAVALQEDGRSGEALEVQRAWLKGAEEEAAADPKNTQAKRNLAVSECAMAFLLAQNGELDRGIQFYRKAISFLENLISENSSNAQVRRDLFVAYLGLGEIYMQSRDQFEAAQCYKKAKAALEILSAAKRNTQARSDLAALFLSLSAWERSYGSPSAALENSRQSVSIRQELLAANPSNALMRRDLALSYSELGAAYEKLSQNGQTPTQEKDKNRRAAEQSYQKSLSLWREMEQKGILTRADVGKPAALAENLANLGRL